MTNRLTTNEGISLQGYLLVAAPDCSDEALAKTVCLVVHHGRQGAIGVFLNRELDAEAPDLWEQLAGDDTQYSKALMHLGGPNSGPVIAVHNHQELAEFTSARGVYFAAQVENLRALLSLATQDSDSQRQAVKIIVGQANWEAGELEDQYSSGWWLPLPVSSKVVFADKHTMWRQAMRAIGNKYIADITGCTIPPPSELSN